MALLLFRRIERSPRGSRRISDSKTRTAPGILLLAALLAGPGRSQEGTPPTEVKKPAPIYDESADAKKQVEAALARAKAENKRVLLVFGANWCGWCRKLDDLFAKNAEVARVLLYEYEKVLVDVGRFDKNEGLAADLGAALRQNGIPFLTVLDAEGKPLANQETSSLEAGSAHDPAKVRTLLEKWAAPPLDAEKVLSEAVARAGKQGKRVFLHFGAPWCPWCHRLEDFLGRKEIEEVLGLDFVPAKIDVDRMAHGKEVLARFRPGEGGGIPWFAFLDGKGAVVATSEGPKGNVGCPVEPEEIDHFLSMLRGAGNRLTPEQVATVEKGLRELSARIKAARKS